MKNFLKRTIIFILILAVLLLAIDLFSFTDLGDNILGRVFFASGYRNIGSYQISPAIRSVSEESDHTKLVIGDSVCNQIFEPFRDMNDDYLIVGTNAGVSMMGQYILAELFMGSHPNATDIYIVAIPGSFSIGVRSRHTFSYLVEPFGKEGLLDRLNDDTIEELGKVYGKAALNRRVVRFLDDSCINNKLFLYHAQAKLKKEPEDPGAISKEAFTYLLKLKDECEKNGVKLHILPGPVKDTDGSHGRYEAIRSEAAGTRLETLFKGYIDSQFYYPSEMFGDGVHFHGEYANEDTYRECIAYLQSSSGELEGLKY